MEKKVFSSELGNLSKFIQNSESLKRVILAWDFDKHLCPNATDSGLKKLDMYSHVARTAMAGILQDPPEEEKQSGDLLNQFTSFFSGGKTDNQSPQTSLSAWTQIYQSFSQELKEHPENQSKLKKLDTWAWKTLQKKYARDEEDVVKKRALVATTVFGEDFKILAHNFAALLDQLITQKDGFFIVTNNNPFYIRAFLREILLHPAYHDDFSQDRLEVLQDTILTTDEEEAFGVKGRLAGMYSKPHPTGLFLLKKPESKQKEATLQALQTRFNALVLGSDDKAMAKDQQDSNGFIRRKENLWIRKCKHPHLFSAAGMADFTKVYESLQPRKVEVLAPEQAAKQPPKQKDNPLEPSKKVLPLPPNPKETSSVYPSPKLLDHPPPTLSEQRKRSTQSTSPLLIMSTIIVLGGLLFSVENFFSLPQLSSIQVLSTIQSLHGIFIFGLLSLLCLSIALLPNQSKPVVMGKSPSQKKVESKALKSQESQQHLAQPPSKIHKKAEAPSNPKTTLSPQPANQTPPIILTTPQVDKTNVGLPTNLPIPTVIASQSVQNYLKLTPENPLTVFKGMRFKQLDRTVFTVGNALTLHQLHMIARNDTSGHVNMNCGGPVDKARLEQSYGTSSDAMRRGVIAARALVMQTILVAKNTAWAYGGYKRACFKMNPRPSYQIDAIGLQFEQNYNDMAIAMRFEDTGVSIWDNPQGLQQTGDDFYQMITGEEKLTLEAMKAKANGKDGRYIGIHRSKYGGYAVPNNPEKIYAIIDTQCIKEKVKKDLLNIYTCLHQKGIANQESIVLDFAQYGTGYFLGPFHQTAIQNPIENAIRQGQIEALQTISKTREKNHQHGVSLIRLPFFGGDNIEQYLRQTLESKGLLFATNDDGTHIHQNLFEPVFIKKINSSLHFTLTHPQEQEIQSFLAGKKDKLLGTTTTALGKLVGDQNMACSSQKDVVALLNQVIQNNRQAMHSSGTLNSLQCQQLLAMHYAATDCGDSHVNPGNEYDPGYYSKILEAQPGDQIGGATQASVDPMAAMSHQYPQRLSALNYNRFVEYLCESKPSKVARFCV